MERKNEKSSYITVLKVLNLEKKNRGRNQIVYPRTDFNTVQLGKLKRIIKQKMIS